METFEMIAFIFIILVICGILGFGMYLYYDFLEHKKQLETDLVKSSVDLNHNFKLSSSSISDISKKVSANQDVLYVNSNLLKSLDQYSSNTSNVLVNRIISTSNMISNDYKDYLNSFDENLNRFFKFKHDGEYISDHEGNNSKIFNYLFTGADVNVELIAETTAVGGMTIHSSADNKFKICSSANSAKCVNMETNETGKFIVSPAGVDNIIFKNKNNSTLANFDSANNAIYFGADTQATANMYVKDNNLFVSSLNLLSADKSMSTLYNFDNDKYTPLYTQCTMNYIKKANIERTVNGITESQIINIENNKNIGDKITYSGNEYEIRSLTDTSDITLTIKIMKPRDLTTFNNISLNIPYLNFNNFKSTTFVTHKNGGQLSGNYINLVMIDSRSRSDATTTTSLSEKLSIDTGTMKISINKTGFNLESFHELTITISSGNTNLTTLNVSPTTYSFVTNSYFTE
jgi:hypothetical protein